MSSEAENLKKFQEFYDTPERIEAGLSLAELIEMNEEWEKERAEKGQVQPPESEDWEFHWECEEGCLCEGDVDPTPERPVGERRSPVERAKGLVRTTFKRIAKLPPEDRESVYELIRELQREIQVAGYPAREAFIREKIEEALGDKVSSINIDFDREDWFIGKCVIYVNLQPNAPHEDYEYVTDAMHELMDKYEETERAFRSFYVNSYYKEQENNG